MNANKFADETNGEIYGKIEMEWAYINSSVFRNAAQEAGYDSRALLSWLKAKDLILTRGRRLTKGKTDPRREYRMCCNEIAKLSLQHRYGRRFAK